MELTTAEAALVLEVERLARNKEIFNPVRMERDRIFNSAALQAVGELGALGIRVPVEHRGRGYSFKSFAALTETLARVDFGFSLALANTVGIAAMLAEEADKAIVSTWLPGLLSGEILGCAALTEPDAGSDLTALATTATRDGDGWLISGRKAWITNGVTAKVAVVYAQTEPGSGPRGIAGFVVDAERTGFIREAAFDLAGPNTAGIGGFTLSNYRALDSEMIQPPGRAFKSAMALVNNARTYVAAMCCGMVAEGLDLASEYGNRRKTFGKTLSEHQGWRWPIADAATDLAAARGLVQVACVCIDTRADVQLEAAQAKHFATRMAERNLPQLAHALGAEGLREVYPLGRHQIAARAANLVDGSTEMLRERIVGTMRKRDG